jgi:hypothetical protein
METGWTNTWIAVVLAMRRLQSSIFDLSYSERLKKLLPNLIAGMSYETTGASLLATCPSLDIRPGAE